MNNEEKMFISCTKPQTNVVWPEADAFASTAATTAALEAFDQWSLDKAATPQLFLGQPIPQGPLQFGYMAPGSSSSAGRWPELLPTPDSRLRPQQGQKRSRTVSDDASNASQAGLGRDENFLATNGLAVPDSRMLISPLPRGPTQLLPEQTEKGSCHYSASFSTSPELAEQNYLTRTSAVAPDFSFANQAEGLGWQQPYHGANTVMQTLPHYQQFSTEELSSGFPQASYDLAVSPESLDISGLPTGINYYDVNANNFSPFGSFSSTGASDLMESMMLDNENSSPPWPSPSPADGTFYNDLRPELVLPNPQFQDGSPWLSSDHSVEAKPASPKPEWISPAPSPGTSTDSINTRFFIGSGSTTDSNSFNLARTDSPLTHSNSPAFLAPPSDASKARKQLPDKAPRQALPPVMRSSNNFVNMTCTGGKLRRSDRHHHPYSPSSRRSRSLARGEGGNVLSRLAPAPGSGPEGFPSIGKVETSPDLCASQQHGGGLSAAASLASPQGHGSPNGSDRDRDAKNEFLIQGRRVGMKYREIRAQGGFTEAESTLRGRWRALTKSREKRVRKPEWSDKDLRLLEVAVRTLARGDLSPTANVRAKISWKQVADYIYNNDGTYLFGNSTCRKRWDELVATHVAAGKDVRRPFYEQGSVGAGTYGGPKTE
ncbi:hypothetical protein B0T24DRAFT_360078 [Lasiosphaeria ovina]|uniref:Myb-like domain-containing protein n=1 Tax=Lasiosphaeria ovina TaxID=92902 RepID=A0AAE0K4C9_9PEZI|nr:hypothetical protein B0T24DRAFT_360078 [Lasiosphaeria ovina]